MASCRTAATGVCAGLLAPAGNTGDAAGDVHSGIQDLGGSGFSDGLGGDCGANHILGSHGNDDIGGFGGNDSLVGGAGADVFVVNAPAGAANADRSLDDSVAEDTTPLAHSVMPMVAYGVLSNTAFVPGTAATPSDHRIIYDQTNGQVVLDADGNGATAAALIAALSPNLALTADEFLVR